jgi:2-polyprenyl-3-methyl-5-hydroxy-6-metoxy-1,4-benzoquinol methylase
MRQKKTLKMIEKYSKGKILDLGCGTGSVSSYLYRKGFDVEGCDISKKRLKIAKNKDPKINYFLYDLDNENLKKKYDTIILMGVLEGIHTLPWKALAKLKRNLNKKGRIIVEVPNFNALQRRIRSFFGREPLDALSPKTYNFTKKRIIQSALKAKYKIKRITTTKFIQIRNLNFPMIDFLAQEFFMVIEKKENSKFNLK